jgi:tRNA(fMet)-specific endonuclease VapC
LTTLPTHSAARRFGWSPFGQPIEDFDLLIGITARENDLAVVTHNTKHFSRIEGLKTEDWML